MKSPSTASVLFLGKHADNHCRRALEFVQSNFAHVSSHLGVWGEPLPDAAACWEGDYIISYLSRWIVPQTLLSKAKLAAINFHPASPEYPGIGCNNFALYDGAQTYGVTCHHMADQVDTGHIVAVKRFEVFPTDDVHTLLTRTYDFQLALFYEIVGHMILGAPLPKSSERWARKPFTRREFDALGVVEPTMPPAEIQRRVRATSYGSYQPQIRLAGYTFELKPAKKAT